MNFRKSIFLTAALFRVFCVTAQYSAQNYTISPYSNFGLGEMINSNLSQAGFQGQTYSGSYSYSFMNPATLTGLKFSTLDFGLNMRRAMIESSGQKKSFTGGSLSYLALGFKTANKRIPIYNDSDGVRKLKKAIPLVWNSAFSFYPNTSVGYNYVVDQSAPFPTRIGHSGSGGVNEANFSTGVLMGKHVSIGYSLGYMFGNISDQSGISVPDSAGFFFVFDDRTANIRGLKNQAGMMFSFGKDSSKHKIGLSYKWYGNTNAVNRRLVYTKGVVNNAYTENDTVLLDNGTRTKISMPVGFGIGYSFNWLKKYEIGLDYYNESWANYAAFFQPGIKLGNRSDYGVSLTINSGNEKTSKAKRMPPPIRLGARYSNTQNVFTSSGVNTQIKETNAYVGFGLPLTRRYFDNTVVRSMFNVRFDYVNRGTLNQGLAKENYFITTVSFNLGDVWFQRRKFD